MDAALLHCLNHLATAAARIKKNNDVLKAGETLDPPRDQGFVRPKVTFHTFVDWLGENAPCHPHMSRAVSLPFHIPLLLWPY